MADCRMVRTRNSGETLQEPTKLLGCGKQGGPSRENMTGPSQSSLSYHRHPEQYPQQCQDNQFYNINGFPPGSAFASPYQHQHHQHQPPQPQFIYNGHNNNQPHLEPPPRPWVQLAHPKHKRACFTVLCYNILCARYATHTLYSYCPGWAIDWNYRRKAILQELIHYAPDIISLQEMETDQFYNFFLPQLQLLGYSGIFGVKSRARTMIESKRRLVDGCAIFYRTNKFRLLSEHLIEFSQVAIANATRGSHFSEEMINRVQTKDNIALAALLETKMDSEQVSGIQGLVSSRSRPLLVCTCHIHWDPNFCDVKLVQTLMLMEELKKITDNLEIHHPVPEKKAATSSPTASPISTSTLDKVQLLLCGDFNSLPHSGVVQFMETGSISCSHPDFKGLNYEGYLTTSPNNSSRDKLSDESSTKAGTTAQSPPEEFQHDFQLHSAYPADTLPFTNYTLEFQGVIDYIFHSVKGLRPLGILGPLDTTWLVHNNIVGAPHPCIPSDHLPLLVELEMIPAM